MCLLWAPVLPAIVNSETQLPACNCWCHVPTPDTHTLLLDLEQVTWGERPVGSGLIVLEGISEGELS